MRIGRAFAFTDLAIGKAIVHLPPAAFLQATAEGEAAGVAEPRLQEGRPKSPSCFAGIGPFALRLAERARVVAVDDDEAALAALKRAAADAGPQAGRDRAARPVPPPAARDERKASTPSCSSAAASAEAQARELAASRAPLSSRSRNPATFARDAATLIEAGYRFADVTPADQFRYTAHVEIVARLER